MQIIFKGKVVWGLTQRVFCRANRDLQKRLWVWLSQTLASESKTLFSVFTIVKYEIKITLNRLINFSPTRKHRRCYRTLGKRCIFSSSTFLPLGSTLYLELMWPGATFYWFYGTKSAWFQHVRVSGTLAKMISVVGLGLAPNLACGGGGSAYTLLFFVYLCSLNT